MLSAGCSAFNGPPPLLSRVLGASDDGDDDGDAGDEDVARCSEWALLQRSSERPASEKYVCSRSARQKIAYLIIFCIISRYMKQNRAFVIRKRYGELAIRFSEMRILEINFLF